ncbi:MAG: protein kinase [Bryobacterales bacterium]|nr:protein kinase [Bryobacterales bacterium]
MANSHCDGTKRIEHVFTLAIRLPGSDREAFVRTELADDETGRLRVLRMLATFEKISRFLTGPLQLDASPEIAPSTIVAQRFRVVRFLAHGGMGAVYEAEDLELAQSGAGGHDHGERVALKFVRADLPDDGWVEKQFRAELALGRKIAHPRICRLYDIHKHEGADGRKQLFFSMELLEGQTLAERMSGRGAWPSEEAWPLLSAIGEGLEAAHAAGIVHRDLKPGNIILTADGPVITDFGLALADPKTGAPHLSSLTAPLGTLPYMAPEQFTEGAVTRAADIFAFGVIAYQFATGEVPFPSESAEAALEARLTQRYQPPPLWREPIAACLRVRPEDRPASIREVVKGFAPDDGRVRHGRRRVLGWAASGAAVSLAAAAGFRYLRRPETKPGLLLVEPGGDIDPGESAALHDLISKQLDQSSQFELLTADSVRQTLARMGKAKDRPRDSRTLAREIALREGALFLAAPMVKRDEGLVIQFEAMGTHPSLPRGTSSETFRYHGIGELIAAAAKASDWIRRKSGESQQDLAHRPHRPEEVSTGSWDALMAYTKAEQARAAGDDNEAIRQLRMALEYDPDFPSANMRLGDILVGQGQTFKGWSLQRKATNLVVHRNLTDREALRIRGLYLLDSDDVMNAEPVFEQWADAYRRDYLPVFYLATCRHRMGKQRAAAATVEEILRRAPGNQWAILLSSQIHMLEGDLAAARRDLDRISGVNAWWWRYDAEQRFLALDLPGVMNSLKKLSEFGSEHRSLAFLLRAYLWADCGEIPEALNECRRGIEFDQSLDRLSTQRIAKWIALGSLAVTQGNVSLAVDAAQRAATATEDLNASLQAAMILYRVGKIAEGDSITGKIGQIPNVPVCQALRLRAAGHRAMALRDYKGAIASFSEAARNRISIDPTDELAEALDAGGQDRAAEREWNVSCQLSAQYWLSTEIVWPGVHRRVLKRLSRYGAARSRLQGLVGGLTE